MKNKRVVTCLLIVLMMLVINGCSLAKADAGDENETPQDRLIGVFITKEYLDLFNMEAYLEDHADELMNGEDVVVNNSSEYNDRIYATVEQHGSNDPYDWEITFEEVEGVMFFSALWEPEGGEPFTMLTGDDEICDVNTHITTTDTGEALELTGTMYVLLEKGAEEISYYMNPVYQTATGEIYLTTGNGHILSGEIGGAFSMSLDEELTITEDGESKTSKTTIHMNFEIIPSEPVQIHLHQMDASHQVIKTETYSPGSLPEEFVAEAETAYIVAETEWANGESTRELFEPEGEGSTYIETIYKINESALGKKSTEVIWGSR